MSASVSFPKQLPPQPIPASKKLLPILLSSPIPFATSMISAPILSDKHAISFIKLIFNAKKAFAEYLISSAVTIFVSKITGLLSYCTSSMCDGGIKVLFTIGS